MAFLPTWLFTTWRRKDFGRRRTAAAAKRQSQLMNLQHVAVLNMFACLISAHQLG